MKTQRYMVSGIMHKLLAACLLCMNNSLVPAPWDAPYTKHSLTPWVELDFDEAMHMEVDAYTKAIKQVTKKVVGIDGNLLYHYFRGLYNKNKITNIPPSTTLRIPKIIHQIWLGGPLPDCFRKFVISWLKFHLDGWQYKLWTDADIEALNMHNRGFYNATDNYGIKADLARMEILYQYGGVYVETDFECLRPLDILHYMYDFYVGIQPLDSQFLQLGIGIIGARAGHPILKHSIETIKDDWHKKGAPQKTGPVHFTRSFYAVSGIKDMIDIALPAAYFYPLGCEGEQTVNKKTWQNDGSFGIHWWAKTWMPASFRQEQFKTIENQKSTESWDS